MLGSGHLFDRSEGGNVYDSLAVSLMKGRAEVAPETVGIEAFVARGQTYCYFAPLPALFRVIPNMLCPGMFGRWARLSCLMAAVLCTAALARILILGLRRNTSLSLRLRRFLLYAGILAFGAGSPLSYLVSFAGPYHESILWALCWSLWGIVVLVEGLLAGEDGELRLFAFSACGALAMLSRVTFAIPFLIITFVYGMVLLYRMFSLQLRTGLGESDERDWRRGSRMCVVRRALMLAVPLGVATLYSVWYNWIRFGDPLAFYSLSHLFREGDMMRLLERSGCFNLLRLPTAIVNYAGLSVSGLSLAPPFVHLKPSTILAPDLYYMGYLEWNVSLVFTVPWLLIGGVWGIMALLRRSPFSFRALVAAAFFAQVIEIMSFRHLAHRYSAEFLPFLVYGLALLLVTVKPKPLSRSGAVILVAIMVVLVVSSAAVNCGVAYESVATLPDWGVSPEFRIQHQGYHLP